jgi:tRNA 2-thiocytidine biosynthesis protein TtcA
VAPSQLADQRLFDFADLQLDRSGERAPYAFAQEEVQHSNNEQVLQFIDALSLRRDTDPLTIKSPG